MERRTKTVDIKQAVIIVPSRSTPTKILPLSSLDSQPFLRFTIEYLLLFRPNLLLDRSTITSRLKSALSQTLVPYFPMAGRVVARSTTADHHHQSDLEVICEGQGALFFEATSDYTRKDLEQTPPKFVDEWRDLLWFHSDDVLKGNPPVVVQLTWLADGSAALTAGFNHCLCDGIGSAQFLRSLAETTRNGTMDSSSSSLFPVWERDLLVSPPLIISSSTVVNSISRHRHPEFTQVEDLCSSTGGFMNRFTTEKLIPTSTIFTRKQINKLKRLATTPLEYYSIHNQHTAFEVISAHIWRSWATALRLNPNQQVKLLFSINIRSRIKPALPTGYYGNGFVLGCANTTAKELIEKPLGYAAGLIRKAKEKVDDSYVREVIRLVSDKACPDLVGVLILSQWSRLGLERVDLFGLGKPVSIGPVCCDRYCLLLPTGGSRGGGGVKAMVALPATSAQVYKDMLRNVSSFSQVNGWDPVV